MTTNQEKYLNYDQIAQAVKQLVPAGELFEIRAISKTARPKVISGIFDNVDNIRPALQQFFKDNSWRREDIWAGRNTYITLNKLNVDTMAAMSQYNTFKADPPTTSDADITRLRWFFIDLDPERRAEISSSDEELQLALELQLVISIALSTFGLKDPIKAMSGNGAHLLYRIDLENTPDNHTLIDRCLNAIKYLNDTMWHYDTIDIDTTVSNPARICKLYGTLAQKGGNVAHRPHRFGEIIQQGGQVVNQRAALAALAAMLPEEPQQDPTAEYKNVNVHKEYNNFNFDDFMNDPRLAHKATTRWNNPRGANATVYPLYTCLFNSDHTNGDAKIFAFDGGGYEYRCKHNSCSGYHWRDARRVIDPEYDPDAWQRKQQDSNNLAEKFTKNKQDRQAAAAAQDEYTTEEEKAELEEQQAEEAERERRNTLPVANLMQLFIQEISDAKNHPYYSTGIEALDKLLDGGVRAGFYCLAALSGLGKSTLALQIADSIAAAGNDVLYISMEMAREELIARSISRHTHQIKLDKYGYTENIPCWKWSSRTTNQVLRGGDYSTPEQKAVFVQAIKDYTDHEAQHLFIREGVGDIKYTQVRKFLRDHKKQYGHFPILFVDYLQLFGIADDRPLSDKQKMDAAVLELKRIARDYKIPVFSISSVSREFYNKPASMAMFKESGAIEFTCDAALGLQPSGYDYNNGEGEGENNKGRGARLNEIRKHNDNAAAVGKEVEIDLKVMKNRNGRKGIVFLSYTPMYNLFMDNKLQDPLTLGERLKENNKKVDVK